MTILALCAAPALWAQQQEIKVYEAPKSAPGVQISGPTIICKGGQTTLKVEGDYESFEWNNGSTQRFIHVKEPGVYEVTVRTKGGCSITSSVNVEEKPCL